MTDDFGGGETAERGVHVAQRLVELVDTLVDDFDSVHLADRLVAVCLDLVGIDAAAVLLLDADGAVDVAASSAEVARMMDVAQQERHPGPFNEALRSGRPIVLNDPTERCGLGVRSVEAFLSHGYSTLYPYPLRRREHTVGALYLFLADRPLLTECDRNLADALAATATTILLHRRQLARAVTLGEQLQIALNTRISVERATGVLAEYADIGMGAAFDALRGYARSNRLKLSLVTEDVVARRLDPGQVVPARPRR